jgi:hypothetical protein
MTAAYTVDVFTRLDGFGSASKDWGDIQELLYKPTLRRAAPPTQGTDERS